MNEHQKKQLFEASKAVLSLNDAGTHTQPAPGLYPHQWLWDSCFIAIGIAHYDTQRAAREIYSLLAGQWSNGMIPHMIFSSSGPSGRGHNLDAHFWQSSRSNFAPDNIRTSGITQPPVIAEACLQIASHMNNDEAKAFLEQIFPSLVAYHSWLYRERDPDNNGIVALIHPWETGLDNTPGWMIELSKIHTPLWLKLIELLQLDWIIERLFRRDIKKVKSDERMSTLNALRLTHVALSLRRHRYNIDAIMRRPHFVIESLSFNSMLIGNNLALEKISKIINSPLPRDLLEQFTQASTGLETLWSESQQRYCHRNYLTGKHADVHGISRLLPLYSGAISKERAAILVAEIVDSDKFAAAFPLPTVPTDSKFYDPKKYWQGPAWQNTNWLIINGLRKYHYHKLADQLTESALSMVAKSGSYEYFNPETGEGLGAENFSWTAALTIDLINR